MASGPSAHSNTCARRVAGTGAVRCRLSGIAAEPVHAGRVAVVGGFLCGYDTGIISGALLAIGAVFRLDHRLQAVVAPTILVNATVGGLGCGWFSDRFGRRRAS